MSALRLLSDERPRLGRRDRAQLDDPQLRFEADRVGEELLPSSAIDKALRRCPLRRVHRTTEATRLVKSRARARTDCRYGLSCANHDKITVVK
jgi:hypothetical protein